MKQSLIQLFLNFHVKSFLKSYLERKLVKNWFKIGQKLDESFQYLFFMLIIFGFMVQDSKTPVNILKFHLKRGTFWELLHFACNIITLLNKLFYMLLKWKIEEKRPPLTFKIMGAHSTKHSNWTNIGRVFVTWIFKYGLLGSFLQQFANDYLENQSSKLKTSKLLPPLILKVRRGP